MGIPKFFRWVTERYPLTLTEMPLLTPTVDNLYLDMNGILHTFFKEALDLDDSLRDHLISSYICLYIDIIFETVRPTKYFFLAIDGVAPRAKMIQQRQRRYRSMMDLYDTVDLEDIGRDEIITDSNAITAGTEWMRKTDQAIKAYIREQMKTNAAWDSCNVIFSGHETPGEGEHKIMEFIRRRKAMPGYDPNETHCLYGLDADLILLALATHEPHFLILRERVLFGFAAQTDFTKPLPPDRPEFVLFHVSNLREYLLQDLGLIYRDKVGEYNFPSSFDPETFFDDFVLMCTLIGNDFVPNIPSLAINHGAISALLELYATKFIKQGKTLTGGHDWIDLDSLRLLLKHIGSQEDSTFCARTRDLQEFKERCPTLFQSHGDEAFTSPILMRLYHSHEERKRDYYTMKLKFSSNYRTNGELNKLLSDYMHGIHWIIRYYYDGVPAWEWFYPHHYAPFASDLAAFSESPAGFEFTLGEPIPPQMQMFGVLPYASRHLLPEAYHQFMKDEESNPLREFFPNDVRIDREGTTAPWEGVFLIPFLDTSKLRSIYMEVQSMLSECNREQERMTRHALCFTGKKDCKEYDYERLLPSKGSKPKLLNGVNHDLVGFDSIMSLVPSRFHPILKGFPSYIMLHGPPSRAPSLILRCNSDCDFESSPFCYHQRDLLGMEVLAPFPYFCNHLVAGIETEKSSYLVKNWTYDDHITNISKIRFNPTQSEAYKKRVNGHRSKLRAIWGVDLPVIRGLVKLRPQIGIRLEFNNVITPRFSKSYVTYPIELIGDNDIQFKHGTRVDPSSLISQKVLYLGSVLPGFKYPRKLNPNECVEPLRGSIARITDASSSAFLLQIKVPRPMPIENGSIIMSLQKQQQIPWLSLAEAARSFTMQLKIPGADLNTESFFKLIDAHWVGNDVRLPKFLNSNNGKVAPGFCACRRREQYVTNPLVSSLPTQYIGRNHYFSSKHGGPRRPWKQLDRKATFLSNAGHPSDSDILISFPAITLLATFYRHYPTLIDHLRGDDPLTLDISDIYPKESSEFAALSSNSSIFPKHLPEPSNDTDPKLPIWSYTERLVDADTLVLGLEEHRKLHKHWTLPFFCVKRTVEIRVSQQDVFVPSIGGLTKPFMPLPLPEAETNQVIEPGARVIFTNDHCGSIKFGERGIVLEVNPKKHTAVVAFERQPNPMFQGEGPFAGVFSWFLYKANKFKTLSCSLDNLILLHLPSSHKPAAEWIVPPPKQELGDSKPWSGEDLVGSELSNNDTSNDSSDGDSFEQLNAAYQAFFMKKKRASS